MNQLTSPKRSGIGLRMLYCVIVQSRISDCILSLAVGSSRTDWQIHPQHSRRGYEA